jgi:hypothetical protein
MVTCTSARALTSGSCGAGCPAPTVPFTTPSLVHHSVTSSPARAGRLASASTLSPVSVVTNARPCPNPLSSTANIAGPTDAGSQLLGLSRPAHRCLCLRFAVRLTTHYPRLEVGIESLLLSRRALSSPTTCRFIPAHSHPCVALSSAQAVSFYPKRESLQEKMGQSGPKR